MIERLVLSYMNKFEDNIKKNTLEELYKVYMDINVLLVELEGKIKELPAKEEV